MAENEHEDIGPLMRTTASGDAPSLHGDDLGPGEVMTGLPFSGELGMRLHGASDGIAFLSVSYDERLVGDPATGVMHGGVITALLDTACGTAVMASAPGKTVKFGKLRATATLDLRIDYMRPATPGQTVIARAECYRLTRAIGFARAIAYHDDAEAPVASAAGAFMLERAKPEAAG
ncbi:MAG: PaaI family thioesterase [Pseudomonadota bacterium]